MMSSPWASILMHLTVLSSVIGYKLPLAYQSFLTGPNSRGEYSSSPPVWEWETQDESDKTLLTLIRMVREISDTWTTESQPDVKYPVTAEKERATKSQPDVKYPITTEKERATETQAHVKYTLKTEMVSKSPLKKPPEVTPQIVLPSKAPYTKPQIMPLVDNETTPSSDVDHISTEGEELNGAETTQTDKSPTAAIKTVATQMKFISTQEQLSTPSSTKLTDLSAFTKSTANEATTFDKIQSTNDKLLSSIPDSTSNTIVEETTTVLPSNIPNDTPSKPILTSAESTTHGKTTGLIPDSKGSTISLVSITHISTTSEDKILNQSLMKQCMLTILILALVCTVFIITTIGLAAKLSTMKRKQKLRHPASYTEMRCISSLLPDSDQQNKAKPKRLKTFAAVEESDGDNTTLNSFLPDH